MGTLKKFEELGCWQESRILVNMVYGAVNKDELFCRDFRLSGQITGASISVMNNIAEGFDSRTNLEFSRFLRIARRSASEVQSCSYVAPDRKFLDDENFRLIYY